MTAADRFTRFGDASDLAERLQSVKPNGSQPAIPLPRVITADMLRKPMSESKAEAVPDQSQQANRLARVANSLTKVSKSLRLIRPNEAMDASAKLWRQLSNPFVIYSIEANARPFALLTESIKHEYEGLALSSSQQRKQPVLALRYERDMVIWLIGRKQYAQAMAIAREWIVSWVMVHTGTHDFSDREKRQEAVDVLFGEIPCAIDQIEEARYIYEELRMVRNDLLHAGKSGAALRGQEMEVEVMKVCPLLSELKLPE